MKYQLADLEFTSKTQITAFFKTMRDKYMGRLNLPITDSYDIKYLTALTQLIEKGNYLPFWQYFTVMKNNYATYGFRMMLNSNFTETLPYTMRIYNAKNNATAAFRYATIKDMLEYRAAHPDAECIHHDMIYFKTILTQFISDRGYDWVPVHHMKGGGFELNDTLLKEEWIAYHRKYAKLKALSLTDHRREHTGRAN